MAKELIWNQAKGQYELAQFTSMESAKKYIDSIALTNVVIQNDEDYDAVKESRTQVNKEVKDISTARKQATAVILSLFEPTLKELERYANAKSDELTKMMNDYRPTKPREKRVFKLEVRFDNPKALEKVTAYAKKYGGVVTEQKGDKEE